MNTNLKAFDLINGFYERNNNQTKISDLVNDALNPSDSFSKSMRPPKEQTNAKNVIKNLKQEQKPSDKLLSLIKNNPNEIKELQNLINNDKPSKEFSMSMKTPKEQTNAKEVQNKFAKDRPSDLLRILINNNELAKNNNHVLNDRPELSGELIDVLNNKRQLQSNKSSLNDASPSITETEKAINIPEEVKRNQSFLSDSNSPSEFLIKSMMVPKQQSNKPKEQTGPIKQQTDTADTIKKELLSFIPRGNPVQNNITEYDPENPLFWQDVQENKPPVVKVSLDDKTIQNLNDYERMVLMNGKLGEMINNSPIMYKDLADKGIVRDYQNVLNFKPSSARQREDLYKAIEYEDTLLNPDQYKTFKGRSFARSLIKRQPSKQLNAVKNYDENLSKQLIAQEYNNYENNLLNGVKNEDKPLPTPTEQDEQNLINFLNSGNAKNISNFSEQQIQNNQQQTQPSPLIQVGNEQQSQYINENSNTNIQQQMASSQPKPKTLTEDNINEGYDAASNYLVRLSSQSGNSIKAEKSILGLQKAINRTESNISNDLYLTRNNIRDSGDRIARNIALAEIGKIIGENSGFTPKEAIEAGINPNANLATDLTAQNNLVDFIVKQYGLDTDEGWFSWTDDAQTARESVESMLYNIVSNLPPQAGATPEMIFAVLKATSRNGDISTIFGNANLDSDLKYGLTSYKDPKSKEYNIYSNIIESVNTLKIIDKAKKAQEGLSKIFAKDSPQKQKEEYAQAAKVYMFCQSLDKEQRAIMDDLLLSKQSLTGMSKAQVKILENLGPMISRAGYSGNSRFFNFAERNPKSIGKYDIQSEFNHFRQIYQQYKEWAESIEALTGIQTNDY